MQKTESKNAIQTSKKQKPRRLKTSINAFNKKHKRPPHIKDLKATKTPKQKTSFRIVKLALTPRIKTK